MESDKKIRQDLSKLDWHFEGDMKLYPAPNILSIFLKWVLTGPHSVSDKKERYHKVDILVSKIFQLVVQNVKTDTTMGQIKDGNLYRALEAHFMFYLTLFKLYLQRYLPMIEKDIREGIITSITCLKNCRLLEKGQAQRNHDEALHLLNHINFFELQCGFDEQLAYQSKFFRNYMTMCEVLLHFIRDFKLRCLELHLESLHAMIPYFFSFDMLN